MTTTNEKPLISIAMAFYQAEEYLAEMLDSVINQSYKNLEIILCDDHSKDHSYEIACNYAKNDPRIRVFQNEKNLGICGNFTRAISQCKGEWIALADHDDIWMENKISAMLAFAQSSNHDLVHCDGLIVDAQGKEQGILCSTLLKKNLNPTSKDYLMGRNNINGPMCFFHNSIIERMLPIPIESPWQDWWAGVISAKSKGVIYMDQPLIYYRIHGNNTVGSSNSITKSSAEDIKKRLQWFRMLIREQKRIGLDAEEVKALTAIGDFFDPKIPSWQKMKARWVYGEWFVAGENKLRRLLAALKKLF